MTTDTRRDRRVRLWRAVARLAVPIVYGVGFIIAGWASRLAPDTTAVLVWLTIGLWLGEKLATLVFGGPDRERP